MVRRLMCWSRGGKSDARLCTLRRRGRDALSVGREPSSLRLSLPPLYHLKTGSLRHLQSHSLIFPHRRRQNLTAKLNARGRASNRVLSACSIHSILLQASSSFGMGGFLSKCVTLVQAIIMASCSPVLCASFPASSSHNQRFGGLARRRFCQEPVGRTVYLGGHEEDAGCRCTELEPLVLHLAYQTKLAPVSGELR